MKTLALLLAIAAMLVAVFTLWASALRMDYQDQAILEWMELEAQLISCRRGV